MKFLIWDPAFSGEIVMRISSSILLVVLLTSWSPGAERVQFQLGGEKNEVLGNILVEAEDGGILLEGRDQIIWPLQPNEILSRRELKQPPTAFSDTELAARVLEELPPGFRVHRTHHYLICYNTSRAYAHWCGALFERLHRAFTNYWSRQGIDLHDTPPLVACVFRDKKTYRDYGRKELGKSINSILGYYSYKTNRIAMYDLLEGRHQRSAVQINKLLRTERTVATIIHEATHQLAFNSGLHARFADIPLWLSEGLAIYFETPDLSSSRVWKTIGAVSNLRLQQFKRYCQHRSANSLSTLVQSDDRFQSVGLATDAYAESWALCHFLIRKHGDEFADYLKLLQKKAPLETATPQQRLEEFTAAFGKSPDALNEQFMKHVRSLVRR